MNRPDYTVYRYKRWGCYIRVSKGKKSIVTVLTRLWIIALFGGEKRRIFIARCILKGAQIVILDEVTAGVDTDNESYIQEAISELVKGKTLLVIAHRLNTI